MAFNANECSNALCNANDRELHVSTLMGFWPNMTDNVLRLISITHYGNQDKLQPDGPLGL